uniref:Elongation of very long chain fatty acids protein n=1 Tax=Platychelipus littoralis TaxID=2593136 RepID=A0A9E8RTD0_9MAXI|nr:fatty acid elongase elovl4 [Platychelipus littoralis]
MVSENLYSGELSKSFSVVTDFYQRALKLGDERVEGWPLMASPLPTLTIALTYILMCVYLPQYMKKKYQLRPLLLLYNGINILMNAYIAFELATNIKGFNWICQPVNYSKDDQSMRLARGLWWYYFSKLFELLDSVFFILRGKTNQLTFLHVYHHSTMFCLWWIGVKYVAGGSSVFGALFNCLVHVAMYSYYFLSALGPEFSKFLAWKKYLTIIQIAQFILAIVMGVNALRVKCDFPLWMQYSMIAYMISFLFLFGNFYRQAYYYKSSHNNKRKSSVVQKKKK